MANFFSSIFYNGFDAFARAVAGYINDALGTRYGILANYQAGDHRPQLKTKVGHPDDNIYQNYTGLGVDRTVSRLFKDGVDFILPEGAEAQQEALDKIWDLNKKELLLYQCGIHGATFGTSFIEIMPEGRKDPYTGELYPRLVATYPPTIRIIVNPHDGEEVLEYRIEYTKQEDGKEIAYRKIIRRANADEGLEQLNGTLDVNYWLVTWEIKEGSALWKLIDATVWEYDFPPMLHWKNLPSMNSVYGESDIDDVINIQDKSNFVVSNNAKIIKHHAHPRTIFKGVTAGEIQKLDDSPDSALVISNPEAEAFNLEIQSDLASSRELQEDLRQSMFDIMREPDISSMKDKVGALTNFGLRILMNDALDKVDTKRQLYGDAILEINRRLLVLMGYDGEASDPGQLQWGEPLPVNLMEEATFDKMMLDMGVVDKESVYQRYEKRYGISWEDVQERLQEARNERQEDEPEREEGIEFTRTDRGGMDEDGQQRPVRGASEEGR